MASRKKKRETNVNQCGGGGDGFQGCSGTVRGPPEDSEETQARGRASKEGVGRTKAIFIHMGWEKRRSPHLPALYPMLTETSRGLVKGMTPVQFQQEVEVSPIYFIEAKLKGKTNPEQ